MIKSSPLKALRAAALLASAALMCLPALAQKPLNKTKQAITLAFATDPGTAMGGVTWDPDRKRYYATAAGPDGSSVECFDGSGITQGAAHVGPDLRGLWFYPETGEVEANGSGELGWFVLALDGQGVPSGPAEEVFGGMMQPEANCAGAYDPVKKCVAFLSKGQIHLYERAAGSVHQKIRLSEDIKVAELAPHAVGCTGKAGYDFAVLHREDGKVILLDRKGQVTGDVALPKGVVTSATEGFAVANGHAWVYQKESHSWLGFPLFE